MRLKSVIIKNFRGYSGEYRVQIDSLTALIGRNDVGKSTILDALGIFFEHPLLKNFGASDVCINRNDDEVIIGCEFEDLPSSIVLDATFPTNLKREHLLNANGNLEILRIHQTDGFSLGSAKYYARAIHPTCSECKNLLSLKITDLKKLIDKYQITPPANSSIKAQLRETIWNHFDSTLNLQECLIPLDKEDAKSLYEKIKLNYPIYALFRADRSSSDEDAEAQDPLKVAISKAISEVQDKLEDIKNIIQEKALEVANRTLGKLHDFDEKLAMSLTPDFRAEPKWETLFKLTLKGDNGIPLNKRGSGVRRLVLFSFFRAESEQIANDANGRSIIYAVEEPETAQHPDFQKMVIDTLYAISQDDDKQVLITTHVPGLASYLPIESIRYITHSTTNGKRIESVAADKEDLLMSVANELGVLPGIGAKLALCVEGMHDVEFLYALNKILINAGEQIIDIENSHKVAVIPMGGSSLQSWVEREYLKEFGIPEIHIYDSDIGSREAKKYKAAADAVNAKGTESHAYLTNKREMENYLHEDAISLMLKKNYNRTINITITDTLDVKKALKDWHKEESKNKPFNFQAEDFLNRVCSSAMTVELLKQRNAYDEILGWFKHITRLVNSTDAEKVRTYPAE